MDWLPIEDDEDDEPDQFFAKENEFPEVKPEPVILPSEFD